MNWQGQECESADMERGQQMSMNFYMEMQSKGKVHTRMECEIRSPGRVVCAALFVYHKVLTKMERHRKN